MSENEISRMAMIGMIGGCGLNILAIHNHDICSEEYDLLCLRHLDLLQQRFVVVVTKVYPTIFLFPKEQKLKISVII